MGRPYNAGCCPGFLFSPLAGGANMKNQLPGQAAVVGPESIFGHISGPVGFVSSNPEARVPNHPLSTPHSVERYTWNLFKIPLIFGFFEKIQKN